MSVHNRKKIIFAIKSLSAARGGAEKVMTQIANILSDTDTDIDIVVISLDAPDAAPLYEVSSNVEYIKLGVGRTSTRSSLFTTLKRIVALRKEIQNQKPDLVIGFMHSIFIPLAFALIGTKIPLIASEHIVPQHYKTRKIEFALFMISSFFVKKITVLSDTIKNSYPEFLHRKMIVITNPVEKPAERKDEKTQNNLILNVGRLDAQKNQVLLIHAFHKLIQTQPQWQLRIVGEGALRETLEALIKELNLSDSVTLVGETPHIHDEYMNADIFALSSDYESFGLCVVEAMSYGVPVIAFADCPGSNELIVNNKNGLLITVDHNNRADKFAEGLERLIVSEEARTQLGQEGIKTSKRFYPGKIAQQWIKIIEENT